MESIAQNLLQIQQKISQACAVGQKPPMILAVSKGQSAEKIRAAWTLGLHDFGENYLSEALQKQLLLQDLPIHWHYIGPIQSNKCRRMAEHFDWVHSVCRSKDLQALHQHRPSELPPLQICLQVNLTGEQSKSGCPIAALDELVQISKQLPRLCLRGLMYIPPVDCTKAMLLALYQQVAQLLLDLNQKHGLQMDCLSIGMSQDIPEAVAAGSTILRIGRALFGERT